jgi:hypothetical protein
MFTFVSDCERLLHAITLAENFMAQMTLKQVHGLVQPLPI